MSYGELAVFNGVNNFWMRDKRALVNQGILDCIFARARDVSKIEPLRDCGNPRPLDFLSLESTKLGLQRFYDAKFIRQIVLDHVIEATEESAIEDANVIGRGNHQAIGIVLLNQLQEAVQHAPYFANIVA